VLRITELEHAIQNIGWGEQKSGHLCGCTCLMSVRNTSIQPQIGNAEHRIEISILVWRLRRSPATIKTCLISAAILSLALHGSPQAAPTRWFACRMRRRHDEAATSRRSRCCEGLLVCNGPRRLMPLVCYELGDLPVGSYRVTARLAGFEHVTRDGVNIVAGDVARLDVAMRVQRYLRVRSCRRDDAGRAVGPCRGGSPCPTLGFRVRSPRRLSAITVM